MNWSDNVQHNICTVLTSIPNVHLIWWSLGFKVQPILNYYSISSTKQGEKMTLFGLSHAMLLPISIVKLKKATMISSLRWNLQHRTEGSLEFRVYWHVLVALWTQKHNFSRQTERSQMHAGNLECIWNGIFLTCGGKKSTFFLLSFYKKGISLIQREREREGYSINEFCYHLIMLETGSFMPS